MGTLCTGSIRIHAQYPAFRKQLQQFGFQLLGTDAIGFEVGTAAHRAALGQRRAVPAIMAHQPVIHRMIGHGNTA